MKKILLVSILYAASAVYIPPAEAQSAVYASHAKRQDIVRNSQTIALADALSELETKFKVSFMYNSSLQSKMIVMRTVPADISESLLARLDHLLTGTSLTYKHVGENFYVIVENDNQPASAEGNQVFGKSPVSLGISSASVVTREPVTMTEVASRTIQGTVIDAEGQGLPGVNVVVKNTTVGTVTDSRGRYTLQVSDEATVLVFSFIGFVTEEVSIGSSDKIDITLVADIQTLMEVVVIGYGETKKEDLTGSVAHVGEDDLKSVVRTSIDQALQGRVSGVVVTNNSGQPGGGVSLRIRGATSITGTNEPLYVIDGVPMDGAAEGTTSGFSWSGGGNGQTAVSKLSMINPDDIVSIDVLKDASASAIYGSRAANGVVLITTKRGKAGESKISYSGYAGVQQLGKTLDVLNLRQYAEYVNGHYGEDDPNRPPDLAAPELLGEGTNWQNELFQNAAIQNHQIGITGGNEKTNYAFSTGYFNQEGIVIGSDFERYSIRLNLDSKVNDWLKIGNSFSLSYSDQKMTLTDQDDGVVAISLSQSPDIPVKNTDGSWAGIVTDRANYSNGDNPVAKAYDKNLNLKRYKAIGNIYFDINFLKDFTFRTEVGGDIDFGNNYAFIPTYQYGPYSKNDVNQSRRDRNQNFYWILKTYLTYNKTIADKHKITALAGHEAQSSTFEYVTAQRQKFSSNEVQEVGAGDATTSFADGSKSDWAMESYFGRLMYSFNDRYFFTGTMRADASSNFGSEYKWGYFPSFAGKWRAINETFMESLAGKVDDLSFRIGYGLTGNQNIPSFQYSAAVGSSLNGFGNVSRVDKIANPAVRWEASQQFNIGLDLAFLNNRVVINADYYIKDTDDALMQRSLPDYMGTNGTGNLSAPFVNLARIQNKGIELTVNTRNIDGDLIWNTGITFSANRNKVLDMGEGVNPLDGYAQWTNLVTRTQQGYPIGMFYGYEVEGLFTSPEQLATAPEQGKGDIDRLNGTWLGDIQFKNQNDDNIIDANDRTIIGNPNPDFVFGINNTFEYKGFDMSVFLQGSYGNDVYNFLRARTESMRYIRDNQSTSILGRAKLEMIDPAGDPESLANWRVINPNASIPRQIAGDPNENSRMSSRYVEDGSYLRIQNVTLGYTLPSALVGKYLSRLRVYSSVQNLYTFTGYSGYDPEVGAFNQDAKLNGVDNGRYPVPRTITFGVNVEF